MKEHSEPYNAVGTLDMVYLNVREAQVLFQLGKDADVMVTKLTGGICRV